MSVKIANYVQVIITRKTIKLCKIDTQELKNTQG